MVRTLHLIHHSHTDIGYTEAPARIERWHADFIRQALTIADRRPSFRWVCETFWGVEQFLQRASPEERERFAEAVRAGRIGLSGSYLNFSELIGERVLRGVTARARAYGDSIGAPVRCALTADINGYSWGFAQALLDAGVTNLFTCIHTHHGMYPLGRTQTGFWWEAPGGGRVLVWSGEHYHFGNELGLVPDAVSSYLTKDECDAERIFHDAWGVAEIRIPRYVARLRESGYPLDFAPVMASGLRTDNGPPNEAVLDQIDRWNREHGDVVRIEMATLETFFDRLHSQTGDLPVHGGDWPDWWSDGAASVPGTVRLFRAAQRDYDRLDSDPDIERDLALFAEHTFSHSDSMSSPWFEMVHAIDHHKAAYVARAAAAIQERMDHSVLRPGLPLRYRVANPHDHAVRDFARLEIGHHEFHERDLDQGFEVEGMACELRFVPRGAEVVVPLELGPGEERLLALTPVRREWPDPEPCEPFDWAGLLRADHPHAPFQPIHDRTPVEDRSRVCAVRGEMVLNRKGSGAIQSAGRLVRSEAVRGEVFERTTLEYEVAGADWFEIEIRRHESRADVSVRMHKLGTWEPENLYLALPFGPGQLWLDKCGAAVRPRIDQLPGTLTDFYSVQAGVAWIREGCGVALSMPDQHLIQLGPLAHGERLLMGDPRLAEDPAFAYAWLMTNYWETNFAADLGGFHEFRYTLRWGPDVTLEAVRMAEFVTNRMGNDS